MIDLHKDIDISIFIIYMIILNIFLRMFLNAAPELYTLAPKQS